MRHLLLALVAVAACTPSPSPSSGPVSSTGPTSTATVASASPAATITPRPTSAPPRATLKLPAGFDRIPWASVNRETRLVTIGVLGRPATTSRITSDPDFVDVQGGAVLLHTGDTTTEIVDAATGTTIATFDREALRLPLPANPTGGMTEYDSAPQRFEVDVEHGYLYDMSANPDGIQLRRLRLDGSDATLLVRLGPDRADEFWDDVDFVVGPTGEVIATACPPEYAAVADHRCRLWRIPAGAEPPFDATHLAATAPRPCFLVAANESYLVGSPLLRCHADGGAPDRIPYMSIDLTTTATRVVTASSNIDPFRVDTSDGVAHLIANLQGTGPFPVGYPAIAVEIVLGDDYFPMSTLFTDDRPGWVWGLQGAGPGWFVRQSFGPEYAACRIADTNPNLCPLGPLVLDLGTQQIELPPGTYGELLPPLG